MTGLLQSRFALEGASWLASGYLRLVRATNRFTLEPPGFPDAVAPDLPAIVAMWHGQHFMIHYAWPPGARIAALISRHKDAELNAVLLKRLGVKAIRGSGGRAEKMRRRGGAAALLDMIRTLTEGYTVVMTADVPKVSRVAGPGIVTLARLSGRPIYPLAVVTSRRFDFRSWDRASLGKPFGRGAMVLGEPIRIARDADADTQEQARQAVEQGLDAVHARAYAIVGTPDPGARPRELGTDRRDAADAP
ncbi:lysophospholipid acyltransferase family protein [Lichenihabitans sp. Uapishka_5]|uniref:lysophospholipid acyltransferase family protein n=1 Tax=Lichenihabitans sp. Uapishka_5 TaxID=3037302 RepID=UPI0029E7D6CD|nr:lysophospholipid acyltransferase family protein [Lichenihabitans sp. Uapishka_5]MDX7953691.1 lysophospholipid acyltransferase family protein [Lichenihabitans sp. Uapishka_5]